MQVDEQQRVKTLITAGLRPDLNDQSNAKIYILDPVLKKLHNITQ